MQGSQSEELSLEKAVASDVFFTDSAWVGSLWTATK